jgi:hypothetical protein
VLGAILEEEVAEGRVAIRDGRFTLNVQAFDPEVLKALQELSL